MDDVSAILQAIEAGDSQAANQLWRVVYAELHRLAAARLAGERSGQTWAATDLVHEVYLRLVGNQRFENRRHFFAAAAEAMRRLLVERARHKQTQRNGGGWQRVPGETELPDQGIDVEQALAVHELIEQLADKHPRQAAVAKLRCFLGCTCAEIAEIQGMSVDSVENDWRFARAWLRFNWSKMP